MNRFKTLYVIGEGSFGVVYLAKENSTGQLVAIKKMKRKYNSWEECMNLREVKSLRKIRHDNIVKLREVFREQNQLHLVFDYIETNLFKFYTSQFKERHRKTPPKFIKETVLQTLKGLAHLHEKGFFHRDLKPENLLINKDGSLKIADFGLAREIRSMPPYTDYISTRWYRAPEMLLKMTNYSHPVDVFALGCIMAELILQKPLFDGKSELDQLHKIFTVLGEPGPKWKEGQALAAKLGIQVNGKRGRVLESVIPGADPQALDLLSKMFDLNPLHRPSASCLIAHAYFDEVRKVPSKSLTVETENVDEVSHVNFLRNTPLCTPKQIDFKDLMGMNLESLNRQLSSSNRIKSNFGSPFPFEKNTRKTTENPIDEDEGAEEISPSMQDFYSSQDENSLLENKSMTDEIQQIINQHNSQLPSSPKDLAREPIESLQTTYANLNLFPFKKSEELAHESKFMKPAPSKGSFMPFAHEQYKKMSMTTLQSDISKKKINTQNKENLGSFGPSHEDILPSYMRLTKNVNSQCDFRFHF